MAIYSRAGETQSLVLEKWYACLELVVGFACCQREEACDFKGRFLNCLLYAAEGMINYYNGVINLCNVRYSKSPHIGRDPVMEVGDGIR